MFSHIFLSGHGSHELQLARALQGVHLHDSLPAANDEVLTAAAGPGSRVQNTLPPRGAPQPPYGEKIQITLQLLHLQCRLMSTLAPEMQICRTPSAFNPASASASSLYQVNEEGMRLYPCASTLELLGANVRLIEKLRAAMQLTVQEFNLSIMPLLTSLAQQVNVLPATQSLHNVHTGGLLHHSLTAAAGSLQRLNRRLPRNFAPAADLRFKLLCSALCHEVGRLITDFRVFSMHDEEFLPGWESLASFIERTCTPRLKLCFNCDQDNPYSSRNPAVSLIKLKVMAPASRLLSAVNRRLRLAAGSGQFGPLISDCLHGGCQDAAASARGSCCGYSLNGFVYATLREKLQQLHFADCDVEHGIFYTAAGLLLTPASPLVGELGRSFAELFEGRTAQSAGSRLLSFILALQKHALLPCGPQPVMRWHKLYRGGDVFYVRGCIIALPQNLTVRARPLEDGGDAVAETAYLQDRLPPGCHTLLMKNARTSALPAENQIRRPALAGLTALPAGGLIFSCDLNDLTAAAQSLPALDLLIARHHRCGLSACCLYTAGRCADGRIRLQLESWQPVAPETESMADLCRLGRGNDFYSAANAEPEDEDGYCHNRCRRSRLSPIPRAVRA